MLAHDRVERSLQFDGHGHEILDQAAALAVRARIELRHAHALGRTLAGHFHEPELRNGKDMRARFVALEALPHALVNSLLVLA